MASLAALLLAFMAAPAIQAPAAASFQPDELLRPPGGPEIAVFHSVPPEVVSFRLSVPLLESRDEAGAGQLIQLQAQERITVLAARIGARAEVHRTPQALVYEVSGASADLDFLAWILREGLRRPSSEEFEGARRQLQVELDRRMETPQGVLFLRVREALAPGAISVAGAPGSLDRMDISRVQAVWARSHRRQDLRLVVAARLPSELILSAVSGLGLGPETVVPQLPPLQDTGAPRPTPEVIRHWTVHAFAMGSGPEAASLVGARWMAEVLREAGGDFEAGVEIWDMGEARALVLSGAAYPRSRQSMDSRIRSLPADAAARLTDSDVRRMADGLRTDIILEGRTPWGLTELVGQAWDSGHGPDGVELLLSNLASLSHQQVLGFLQFLANAIPLREELHP